MALAHSQIYSYFHWTRVYDGGYRGLGAATEWWFQMKEAFKAGGWTVMGTAYNGAVDNSGVTANVDGLGGGAGVDLMVAALPNNSNRAWVVLQCPPIMGDFQVMFFTDQPPTNNPEYWQVDVSPLGQFMGNNGGVNGTTSAPPTAPDSHSHYNNAPNGVNQNGGYTLHIDACWSADKSQFFLMTNQENANAQFMAFSILDNPAPALDNGLAWCILGAGNLFLQASTWMSSANQYAVAAWRGSISGVVTTCYLGGRGWANLGMHDIVRVPGDGKAPPGPCEIYPSGALTRGFHGTVPDMYWVPEFQYRRGYGDAVGGPINWFCGGALIIPWDSARPLPRNR